MDLDFLIDHMKRKLPMSDKVGNAIVAELKKSLELQERVKGLEEALRLISRGHGLVKDKSTVYMNWSSPVVQKHFNTRDMIEIASKALEAECK